MPGISTFAYEHTPSNSYRFVWTDAAINRDTNNLFSAALELFRNGDWCVTTNGTARWGQRALPFPHNGFGQDDEWVAANFTNATEILSVGYPQWVDAQMGEGLTNGLYKFTATCFCLLIVREGQPLLYKLHCICLILRNSIMVKCKKMK